MYVIKPRILEVFVMAITIAYYTCKTSFQYSLIFTHSKTFPFSWNIREVKHLNVYLYEYV